MIKKPLFFFAIWAFLSVFLLACQPPEPETLVKTVIVEKEGQTVVETVIVTVEPTPIPTETPVPEDENCCDVYRIGIFEEPVSLNYWNYLGPGNSVWTRYVISGVAAQLFEISDKRFQFIPSLARHIPTPEENEAGGWVIRVEMVEDALWSDGKPITAHDVAFTHNTCKDLKLNWHWPTFCSPDGAQVQVEVVDDFTVEYVYTNTAPTLRNWQFGVAISPVLPQHYWEDVVAEAYRIVAGLEAPQVSLPENCELQNLSDFDLMACDAWVDYEAAYAEARQLLYQADSSDQPVAGGYLLDEWEAGEYIRLIPNENYYFSGTQIVEYADGTWKRIRPDGDELVLYGEASGDEVVRYSYGPYNPEVVYHIYGSQEAAFGALAVGEIDYVLNPIWLPRNIIDQTGVLEDLKTYLNPNYDLFYLAFNMRSYPMSAYEFRQAFDILIDRELVITEILGDVVLPQYSTMPAANSFWHNPNLPRPYEELTRAERIESAVQVLKDAGWRWDVEPHWDEFAGDVIPGEGLVMPTGEPMPELTILGPGPDFDIVRATFNQWISEWARELGMPVQSELTGRNAILDSVFVAADYDMYIYGWLSLGNPAYPIFYDEFWHSRNCTFETGNLNTPCFKNDAYDALVDEFNQARDLERAQELVREMQVFLADQRPYIPLYSQKVYDFARQNVAFPYVHMLGGIEFQDGFQTNTKVLLPDDLE